MPPSPFLSSEEETLDISEAKTQGSWKKAASASQLGNIVMQQIFKDRGEKSKREKEEMKGEKNGGRKTLYDF